MRVLTSHLSLNFIHFIVRKIRLDELFIVKSSEQKYGVLSLLPKMHRFRFIFSNISNDFHCHIINFPLFDHENKKANGLAQLKHGRIDEYTKNDDRCSCDELKVNVLFFSNKFDQLPKMLQKYVARAVHFPIESKYSTTSSLCEIITEKKKHIWE